MAAWKSGRKGASAIVHRIQLVACLFLLSVFRIGSPHPGRLDDPLRQAFRLQGLHVLLLHGASDPYVPLEAHSAKMQRAIGPRTCALVRFPGAGHDWRCWKIDRILAFLKQYAPDRPPVILFHAFKTQGSDWFSDRTPRGQLTRALKSAGYPLIVDDFAGNAWGNAVAVRRMEVVTGRFRRVCLIGESMGGLLMWRYALAHKERVACAVSIYPVCNLDQMLHSQFAGEIRRAYALP